MSNSTFIEEERSKGFWQERYEELRKKYDQLLKSKDLPAGLDEAAEEYATYDLSNLFPGLNGTPLGEESLWKQILIKTFKAGVEWSIKNAK